MFCWDRGEKGEVERKGEGLSVYSKKEVWR